MGCVGEDFGGAWGYRLSRLRRLDPRISQPSCGPRIKSRDDPRIQAQINQHLCMHGRVEARS
jgi:hypothetical protein